jgi:WD40 repeat protein
VIDAPHPHSVYCLDFDSRRIITGSRDRTIKVWCIRTGECLATFEAHQGSVLCLKFEKDFDALGRSGSCEGLDEERESHGLMVSGSSDCTAHLGPVRVAWRFEGTCRRPGGVAWPFWECVRSEDGREVDRQLVSNLVLHMPDVKNARTYTHVQLQRHAY